MWSWYFNFGSVDFICSSLVGSSGICVLLDGFDLLLVVGNTCPAFCELAVLRFLYILWNGGYLAVLLLDFCLSGFVLHARICVVMLSLTSKTPLLPVVLYNYWIFGA